MRACVIVPAYQAAKSLASVTRALRAELGAELGEGAIFVVDDGSTDQTAEIARAEGVVLVSHVRNRGKGAALRSGMDAAWRMGFDVALTVDADGQHPAHAARVLLEADAPRDALVLGIRDLDGAGAPKANRTSNGISNFFISRFAGTPLADTQCGLRRYPLPATLELGGRADGYAFEAEVILRAHAAGMPIVQVPVDVYYPPEEERITHFHKVRDPARIVGAVVRTLADIHLRRRGPSYVQRGS
ncbi:MAG TPA: glycosyltransferase family 2 protein [Polyangiaceae bacterium]